MKLEKSGRNKFPSNTFPRGNKFTRKYVPGGTYFGSTNLLVHRQNEDTLRRQHCWRDHVSQMCPRFATRATSVADTNFVLDRKSIAKAGGRRSFFPCGYWTTKCCWQWTVSVSLSKSRMLTSRERQSFLFFLQDKVPFSVWPDKRNENSNCVACYLQNSDKIPEWKFFVTEWKVWRAAGVRSLTPSVPNSTSIRSPNLLKIIVYVR